MFNNLKIRSKILVGFVTIIIVTLIVGLAGYSGMSSSKKAKDGMATVYIPSLVAISNIQSAQTQIKAYEYSLLNSDLSIDVREKNVVIINSYAKKLDDAKTTFAGLDKTAEDLEL